MILNEILPDRLKHPFMDNQNQGAYFPFIDILSLNRRKLISNTKLINNMQRYFHRRLSKKEIIIISLLHELGHKHTIEDKNCYIQKYQLNRAEFQAKYSGNSNELLDLLYWQEIEGEKQAMEFAKEYFFRYKIRSIIKKYI